MTRRGSIVYYMSAVVLGCFFIAAAFQGHTVWVSGVGESWARDFLFAYFLAVIGGFVPVLLFAFLLRRTMRAVCWQTAWQWTVAGAVLGTALMWSLTGLGYFTERLLFLSRMQTLKFVVMFPLVGPVMFATTPVWFPPLAFAATALVLYRIHRAFEPKGEPAN